MRALKLCEIWADDPHSLLPWELKYEEADLIYVVESGSRTLFVLDKRDYPEPDGIYGTCLGDALYVVKACNMYEDLIEVVRELVEDVRAAHGRGGDDIDASALNWPDLHVTYRKAVAALRRAGE